MCCYRIVLFCALDFKNDNMKREILEYDNEGNLSIVRTNLMNEQGYVGYCGNSWNEQKRKGCDMPRTKWDAELNQFRCPKCGWVSQFPPEFITRYKERWGK
jgi:hypothetical protein